MVDIFSKVNSGYTEKLPDLNYEIVFNPYIHIYIFFFQVVQFDVVFGKT